MDYERIEYVNLAFSFCSKLQKRQMTRLSRSCNAPGLPSAPDPLALPSNFTFEWLTNSSEQPQITVPLVKVREFGQQVLLQLRSQNDMVCSDTPSTLKKR